MHIVNNNSDRTHDRSCVLYIEMLNSSCLLLAENVVLLVVVVCVSTTLYKYICLIYICIYQLISVENTFI